jgi:hypothetical protein
MLRRSRKFSHLEEDITMMVLDVAMFATEDADWRQGMEAYIFGANYQLASFDMKLNPYMATSPIILPISGRVHDRPSDFGQVLLPGRLRALAHQALPQPHGIPVIFCKFYRTGDAGSTIFTADLATNENVRWLNYALINADVVNPQRGTILHELIHCADYVGDIDMMFNHFIHDSDVHSIMRSSGGGDIVIETTEKHAAALRTCYFARSI